MSVLRIAASRIAASRIVVVVLLALPGSLNADEPRERAPDTSTTGEAAVESLIERYLKAVRTLDWDTMGAILAPDAHYLDTAMTVFDRPPVDLRGPEAIIGFFRSANEQSAAEALRYDIKRQWTAGDTTVVDLVVHFRAEGAFLGMPGKMVEIDSALITILRVVDGRVTYHADYPDYPAFQEQAEAQRSATAVEAKPPEDDPTD